MTFYAVSMKQKRSLLVLTNVENHSQGTLLGTWAIFVQFEIPTAISSRIQSPNLIFCDDFSRAETILWWALPFLCCYFVSQSFLLLSFTVCLSLFYSHFSLLLTCLKRSSLSTHRICFFLSFLSFFVPRPSLFNFEIFLLHLLRKYWYYSCADFK